MTALDEWTADELQGLCDSKAEEAANLEFKAGRALMNTDANKAEMAKDVSAMANAAGGLIIYGIAEEGGKAHHLEGVDDPTITSDWIGQVLDGGIEPRLAGIGIRRLALPDQKSIFLVQVPQASVFAPHQATKRTTYYRRHGTKVLAMLDHEVRDLMRRASQPHLELEINVLPFDGPDLFRLVIGITNLASEPALYTAVDIALDNSLRAGPAGWAPMPASLIDARGRPTEATMWVRNMMVPDHMPIIRDRSFSIFESVIRVEPDTASPAMLRTCCPGFKSETQGFIKRLGRGPPVYEVKT